MTSIRIVIAEDQTLVLGAIAALLSLEPDFTIVGRAADGDAALDGARPRARRITDRH